MDAARTWGWRQVAMMAALGVVNSLLWAGVVFLGVVALAAGK